MLANNLTSIVGGSTSKVYLSSDSKYVIKQPIEYLEFNPFEREICILDKLKRFSWSPKLVCVGSNYFITKNIGKNSCAKYPHNYSEQINQIVSDMESVGIRHNDMLKYKTSDILIDTRGIVHLTDFGWGSVNKSLALQCNVNGRYFTSSNTRPIGPVIDNGFSNKDERHHTNPCHGSAFVPFRQHHRAGSQVEVPLVKIMGNEAKVSGYQNYEMTPTYLKFHGHPKYTYLRKHLPNLTRPCLTNCRFVDIGSNTGLVSFIAERSGFSHIEALDHDLPAIQIVQKVANVTSSIVHGRIFHFGEALPKVDVAFCGALIHWVFCLTADFRGDFDRILRYLTMNIRYYLVIEWVDRTDPAIKSFHHIQRCGMNIYNRYSRDAFAAALRAIGRIVDVTTYNTRVLYTVRIS